MAARPGRPGPLAARQAACPPGRPAPTAAATLHAAVPAHLTIELINILAALTLTGPG